MAEPRMPEPKVQTKFEESLIIPFEKIKQEVYEILKKMKLAEPAIANIKPGIKS